MCTAVGSFEVARQEGRPAPTGSLAERGAVDGAHASVPASSVTGKTPVTDNTLLGSPIMPQAKQLGNSWLNWF